MESKEIKVDSVHHNEATYKFPKGGLNVGMVDKGIRINFIEEEIIIISLGESSQLKNKEKCRDIYNSYTELQQQKAENERKDRQLEVAEKALKRIDLECEECLAPKEDCLELANNGNPHPCFVNRAERYVLIAREALEQMQKVGE